MRGLSIGAILTGVLMTTAGKIMSALGLSFISYAAANALQQRFAAWMASNVSNFPSDALQIFYIAGGGVVLNWFFGALTFIAALKSTAHLSAVLKSK
ncbi:DUF2523 family protein [Eikenella corrodens]|uniref:DUF2523 family protein n=1 Tax=Eikenella corrodens TaxID=539 RepID=UPI00241CF1EC|nr:DUF2523 family protein [Eikenella corrodens]